MTYLFYRMLPSALVVWDSSKSVNQWRSLHVHFGFLYLTFHSQMVGVVRLRDVM